MEKANPIPSQKPWLKQEKDGKRNPKGYCHH
jgi:hypothetical protein